jgi:hypothetical protein
MMKLLHCMLHISLLLVAPCVVAQLHENDPSVRLHYQIVTETGEVAYDITAISSSSNEQSQNWVLVGDTEHGDFMFRHTWTYKDQMTVDRLSDARDQIFLQATSKMPFSATTRAATVDEARVADKMQSLMMTFETNGARWDGLPSEWDDLEAKRHFRYEVRRALDRFLLEAIERTRGVPFKDGTMDLFQVTFANLVLYTDSENDLGTRRMRIKDVAPDCAFDARFGFPCSAKQLARIKKAAEAGKPLLSRY